MKEVKDMTEIWMDLKGYDGKYQVSNEGRIWSVYSNKVLKPGYEFEVVEVMPCQVR